MRSNRTGELRSPRAGMAILLWTMWALVMVFYVGVFWPGRGANHLEQAAAPSSSPAGQGTAAEPSLAHAKQHTVANEAASDPAEELDAGL